MKQLITATFKSLFRSHEAIEIRIKTNGTMSGWFFGKGSGSKIIDLIERHDESAEAIYVTLNPVSEGKLASHPYAERGHTSKLTKDGDITRRTYILIDVDPERPADTSSTDEEKAAAYSVINSISTTLKSLAFPEPFFADSGNGYHLLLPCDLPNTPEVTEAIKGFLKRLASDHSTPQAKVDTVVYNAARIVKLYGTVSRKGHDTPERPHRRSQIISVPEPVGGAVTMEMLEALQPVIISEQPRKPAPAQSPEPASVPARSGNRKYVMTALDSAIQKIQSAGAGQRNNTLNTEAFSIAQLVGAGELNEQMAWASLASAAESIGLLPPEIDSTLHSAFSKGKTQPRKAPEAKQRQIPAPAQRTQPEPIHEAVDPETGEIVATTQAVPASPSTQDLSHEAFADMARQWVYVEATKMFVHLKTMRQLSVEAFNMSHMALFASHMPEVAGKKPNAANFLMKDLAAPVVHNTMYLPTMWNGDPIFEIDGIRYLNTYNDSGIPDVDPNWQAHDAWKICLEHIQNILPNDWHEVLMFMAHNVQNPGKKILWAPIIVGIQGDGKTVLAKMMASAMGAKHTKVVGMQATRSEFNSWAEGSCLAVFEEIRAPGHSRHDFMNKLKELITNDVIDVVAKGRDGRNVVNTQNYMALSNFKDALAIDEHDRRWGVFFTRFKDRAEVVTTFGQEYWAKLNDYAIKGFPEVIRGWLMSIDLSAFDRHAGPKTTDAKMAMVKGGVPEWVQSAHEAIEIGGRGVSTEIISTRCLNDLMMNLERTSLNTSRMAIALQALHYKQAGIVKWDRGTHRVWVRADAEIGSGAGWNETLRNLLEDTR